MNKWRRLLTMPALSEKPLAFLDTETTGLIPGKHEVIEVAVLVGNTLHHWMVRPERLADAEPRALEINGYAARPERWKDARTMREVGPEIMAVLKGTVVVGHNVGFDLDMLNGHMRKVGLNPHLPYHKVDTVTLAYTRLAPLGLGKLSLDTIREFLGWSKEGAHTAAKDVTDTARLYRLLTCSSTVGLRLGLWLRKVIGREV
jgi:DNA polymerase-3 subunit epsilon